MRQLTYVLPRALWTACVCLLLLPGVAAAVEPSLDFDFDGDGRHDRVVFDGAQPSTLHIWLSASGTTHRLHSRAPLQQVVAQDLDGDHHPELIARDSESRIHVWKARGGRFRSVRPRHHAPAALKIPDHGRVNQDQDSPSALLNGSGFAPAALARAATPHVASDAFLIDPSLDPAARSTHRTSDPFAPRPPPAAAQS